MEKVNQFARKIGIVCLIVAMAFVQIPESVYADTPEQEAKEEFTKGWHANGWLGSGSDNNPYQVTNAAQLGWISNQISYRTAMQYRHFKLMNDIDMEGITLIPIGNHKSNGEYSFDLNPFGGTFDGNNHSINNLSITSGDCVGLFGELGSTATVKNLKLENCNINAHRIAGGIAGRSMGHVENCSVTGVISARNTQFDDVIGGIVGMCWVDGASIKNCTFTGRVNGNVEKVGGILGTSVNSVSLSGNVYNATEYSSATGAMGVAGNTLGKDVSGATTSKIKVSFNANGGSGSMNSVDVVKTFNMEGTEVGTKYTLPECSFGPVTGKFFSGWQVGDKIYGAGDEATIKGNTQIKATWSDKRKLLFDANGGGGSMDPIYVSEDWPQIKLPNCDFSAPTGKKFGYWDVNGKKLRPGNDVTFYDEVTIKTAKAVWIDAGSIESETWDQEWYYVDRDITINQRITVQGNVNLVLKDGFTLYAKQGITVEDGNSLTIWGDALGTGKLKADGCYDYLTGIGGVSSQGAGCGAITINGGIVEASGTWQYGGAGIGGKHGCGTITINGGVVKATGSTHGGGPGIGFSGTCDRQKTNGVVVINGGVVTAEGGSKSSGIGSYQHSYYPSSYGLYSVTINGGQVTATGKDGVAGIAAGNVTIGWTNPTDYVVSNDYSDTRYSFVKTFFLDGTTTVASQENAAEKKLVPAMTVSFDANGGTKTMDSVQLPYGSTYTLLTCAFKAPSHKKFDKWLIGTEKHDAGDEITVNADTVVKATWKEEDKKVKFIYNGHGSTSDTTVTVEHGARVAQPQDPTDENYSFAGWYVKGTDTSFDFAIPITQNKEVEAHWRKIVREPTVSVTGVFTYKGTAITPDVTVKDGDTVIPATEYRVEYENNTHAGTATYKVVNNPGGSYVVEEKTGTFEIGPKPVTIKAKNKGKTYGDTDPTPEATATGLAAGDNIGLFSYTFTREIGENVGTYTITPTGDTRQGDYVLTFETGILTIGQKTGVITTGTVTYNKHYGDDDFTLDDIVTIPDKAALTFSVEGSKNAAGETIDNDKIITVDGSGKVHVIAVGSAQVKVDYAGDNNHTAAESKYITVNVDKAVSSDTEMETTHYYEDGGKGEIDIASLLPGDCGNVSYNVNVGGELTFTEDAKVTDGRLTYMVGAGEKDRSSKIVVTVSSKNYEDKNIVVLVKLVDQKITVLKEGSKVSLNGNTLTFGDALSKLAFDGVAVFVEQGTDNEIKGKLVWVNKDEVLAVGTKGAAWRFIPDSRAYTELTGTVDITVNPKPEPAVAPQPAAGTGGSTGNGTNPGAGRNNTGVAAGNTRNAGNTGIAGNAGTAGNGETIQEGGNGEAANKGTNEEVLAGTTDNNQKTPAGAELSENKQASGNGMIIYIIIGVVVVLGGAGAVGLHMVKKK